MVDQAPDITVCRRQLRYDAFDFLNGLFINRVFTPQLNIGLSVRNAHQDGLGVPAVGIKGIDAMVIPVPNGRQFGQPLRVGQDRIANFGRAAFHLGKTFNQIDPGARRVERQEDDNGDVLVGAAQPGNQVDQQAFCVGPHVVQFADQQD